MTTYNTGNPIGSPDPKDLYDNAENFDEAINSNKDTFIDRLGKSRPTLKGGVDPSGLVQTAVNARDDAIAARDAAIINSKVFPDEATGRAAVADGEYFKVIGSGDVAAREYKRLNASTSVLITEYPSSEVITPLRLDLRHKVDKLPIAYYQNILFSVADKDNRMTWLSVNSDDGGPTKESANLIKKSIGMAEPNVSDTLFSVVDRYNQMTWLSVDSRDGGPTKESANLIKKSIGMTEPNVPEVFYSVVDKDNHMTDLTLDDSGQLADWVIERLAKRMLDNGFIVANPKVDAIYPQLTTTEQAITGGDFYNRNGEILPVLTDMTKLSGWGSSSMSLSASAYEDLAASIGATYYDGGWSGTRTEHIAAHLGAIPPLLNFENNTIRGSGRSKFLTSSMSRHGNVDMTGWVAGIHGRLYADSGWWFEPTNPIGSDLRVEPEMPFYSEMGGIYRNGVCILWMGRNNLKEYNPGGEIVAISQTDKTFDFIAPLVKRTLVLGHMIGQHEVVGGMVWNQITQVNEAHRRRYGHLYIDVMEYLTSERLWTDLGITPTQADLDNQAAGKTPPSAARSSSDNLHLTNDAYRSVVMHAVKPRMIQLGWID